MSKTRTLCTVRVGYRSYVWADNLVVLGEGKVYAISFSTIKQGDVLPREGDKPLCVQ